MLDVEGGDWNNHTHAENRAFMLAIKQVGDLLCPASGLATYLLTGTHQGQGVPALLKRMGDL
jgi:hypothetical protein